MKKVARDMLGERFRPQMVMDGHYPKSLAFVATCTDESTLSEFRRNMRANEKIPEESAELRNSMVKHKIRTVAGGTRKETTWRRAICRGSWGGVGRTKKKTKIMKHNVLWPI